MNNNSSNKDTITTEQQYLIKKAVNKKALGIKKNYKSIYNHLYESFKIPRYTELKKLDFERAMSVIERYNPPITYNKHNQSNDKHNIQALTNQVMLICEWFSMVYPKLLKINPVMAMAIVGNIGACRFYSEKVNPVAYREIEESGLLDELINKLDK